MIKDHYKPKIQFCSKYLSTDQFQYIPALLHNSKEPIVIKRKLYLQIKLITTKIPKPGD